MGERLLSPLLGAFIRFQIIIACLVYPIDVPFLSSMRAYFVERWTKTPFALQWLSTPLLVNENNKLTRQNVYLYLIKLAQQKDANFILTWKCFTIAIKKIWLQCSTYRNSTLGKILEIQLTLISAWRATDCCQSPLLSCSVSNSLAIIELHKGIFCSKIH